MSRNGSGVYSAPSSSFNPAVAGTIIDQTDWAALLADIVDALTSSIASDGQTTTTAAVPFAEGLTLADTKALTFGGTGVVAIPTGEDLQFIDNFGSGQLLMQITGGHEVYFPSVSTSANAANAVLDNSNTNLFLRSTSSLAYKTDVQPLTPAVATLILDQLQPFTYRSKAAADDPQRRFYGLGAEDVAVADPSLVSFTKAKALAANDPRANAHKGKPNDLVPDGVQYERICVLLLAERKSLLARIAALEAKP